MFVTSIIVKETQHPPPTAGSSRKGASSVLGFFFLNIFRKLRQCNKDTQIRLKRKGGGYDTFFLIEYFIVSAQVEQCYI